jgi:DNA-binding winged helix-turn-helix (wHTH) protein
MPEVNQTPKAIRFGPFELSVETGELRKNGVRLNLAGQPIDVLTLLVKTPGELVTREALQRRLWHEDDINIDFEKGLNAAVNRLRDFLSDSATDPKYIETVPGRGYRFIAQVDTPSASGQQKVNGPSGGNSDPQETRQRWLFVSGAIILFDAALIGWWKILPVKLPVVESIAQLTDDGEPKKSGLASDGSRIYFNEGQTKSWKIAQVSVTGGRTSIVDTRLIDPEVAAVAPDGSGLLTLLGATDALSGPLWSISLPTGKPRRLAMCASGSSVCNLRTRPSLPYSIFGRFATSLPARLAASSAELVCGRQRFRPCATRACCGGRWR